MVDVTGKEITSRSATALCRVSMTAETRDQIIEGSLPKGDALEVARIAGLMGAKKTSELIPLCHPIAIGAVDVECVAAPEGIDITATVKTNDRTGVEMEALTAVAVAGLTVYDMIKGIDRSASVSEIRLLEKTGGRSGDWRGPG